VAFLNDLYLSTIQLAADIFGDLLFRPWDVKKGEWSDRAQVAFADAVLVSLGERLSFRDSIVAKKDEIIRETINLFEAHPPGTFTGQKNTKKDVQDRISLFGSMLDRVRSGNNLFGTT
jgi:hypothetical protein